MKPTLGSHWKGKGTDENGYRFILNGFDNGHLGPFKCLYELRYMAPGPQEDIVWVSYENLMKDFEMIEN